MGKRDTHASCEFKAPGKSLPAAGKRPGARLHRHRADFTWSGVRTERYKEPDGSWSGVLRRTLLDGSRGEKTKFHLRYFEVAPGGSTSFERHRHEHAVLAVRGRGRCVVNRKAYDLKAMDVIYIPPDAPHRLENPHRKPFGFFCVVDARRDRPAVLARRKEPSSPG